MSHQDTTTTKRFNNKKLWLGLLIIIVVNVVAYHTYIQLDLTHDKRYTLHDKTKKMLQSIQQPVQVKVFLTGDELPADFKRLALSTENILRTFRDISHNKIEYSFIDPILADTATRMKMQELGVYTIPVTVSKGSKGTKQIPVSPFVLVESTQGSIPVALQNLSSQRLTAADINQSEILLEYNIANAIRKVNKQHVDTLLYLLGHQESGGHEVYKLATQLSLDYVFFVDTLQRLPEIPSTYKAIIINKPQVAFSEEDKYKIDQFVMKGGHVLFNLDQTTASFDSFKVSSSFTALPLDLNLSDLLFNYGMRVNSDVVSDLDKCVDIPLQSTDVQNANSNMVPFRYMPIAEPGSDHPIVKNLNEILIKFASSIDFVNDQDEVKKTRLIQTSKYARAETLPKQFELSNLFIEPMRSQFDKPNIILGALAEGHFHSLYEKRLPQELLDRQSSTIKQSQSPSRVIVFSDGDIFLNEMSEKYGPMEMGTYMFSPYVFSNSSLLMNVMEYLCEDDHLLDARTKYYEPSILDRKRIQNEANTWQIINIGVPVLIVLIFGFTFTFLRKRKYSK